MTKVDDVNMQNDIVRMQQGCVAVQLGRETKARCDAGRGESVSVLMCSCVCVC